MVLIGVTVRIETMKPLTLRVELRAVYTKRRWWITSYLINWGLHPISGVTRLVIQNLSYFIRGIWLVTSHHWLNVNGPLLWWHWWFIHTESETQTYTFRLHTPRWKHISQIFCKIPGVVLCIGLQCEWTIYSTLGLSVFCSTPGGNLATDKLHPRRARTEMKQSTTWQHRYWMWRNMTFLRRWFYVPMQGHCMVCVSCGRPPSLIEFYSISLYISLC